MYAISLISNELPYAKPTDLGIDVLGLLEEFKVEHIAVVRNGYYVGVLSESELLEMNNPENELESIRYCTAKPHVKGNQHFMDVLRVMSDNNLTLVPVVDDKETYLGSISAINIISTLTPMLSAEVPGGLLVLEMAMADYSLSEISRIIESNDGKVLSLMIEPISGTSKIEVTIKINKEQIDDIIQAFNRFEYTVKASFHQSMFNDEIKDRYDELMKYLDI